MDALRHDLTRGGARRWEDGHEDTWELEDHVPPELIAAFEEQQRQRLLGQASSNGASAHAAQLPAAPAHARGGSAGSAREAAAALA